MPFLHASKLFLMLVLTFIRETYLHNCTRFYPLYTKLCSISLWVGNKRFFVSGTEYWLHGRQQCCISQLWECLSPLQCHFFFLWILLMLTLFKNSAKARILFIINKSNGQDWSFYSENLFCNSLNLSKLVPFQSFPCPSTVSGVCTQ